MKCSSGILSSHAAVKRKQKPAPGPPVHSTPKIPTLKHRGWGTLVTPFPDEMQQWYPLFACRRQEKTKTSAWATRHYETKCIGSCPDNSVTVSTGLGDPIPTIMRAANIGLPPADLKKYEPPVHAGFDIFNMTEQQQKSVSACMATGGEYGGESIEPPDARQAIAQVRGSNGKPLQYRGNNKPIIPNTKGAKNTPRVTGPARGFEVIAGGLNCVQNVANQ